MPVELQDSLIIVSGLITFGIIDYFIVKYIDWRKSKKPAPRGATLV